MRRIIFAILAAVGLLATVGLTPATAATATPTMDVSYNAFQNITNQASACAVVVPDVSYVIPIPAGVLFEVNNVTRYGYHSIDNLPGYSLINNGGYPGQVLVANYTRAGVYPAHQYDVFVPGYQGRSCTQWVHLVAQG